MLLNLKNFANKPAVKETLIAVASVAATVMITAIALEVAKMQSDFIVNKILDIVEKKD